MRRFLAHILALALVLSPMAVLAQEYVPVPVEISKDKVKVNGQLCYSHVVLEKQTLYSISKAYGVSIEDIYSVNPTLQETGLKKNAIILIPAKEVTVRTHTVKWYEDLSSIARKYKLSVEELMAANNLSDKKLKSRQQLVIPEPGTVAVAQSVPMTSLVPATPAETPAADEQHPDKTQIASADSLGTNTEPAEQPAAIITPKEKLTATLALPFNVSANPNRNNMDFYSGVLLAVRELADKGISTELNVVDLSSEAISKNEIGKSDVVLGPITQQDLAKVLKIADGQGYIVSPLDVRSEELALSHRNFISSPTSHRTQYEELVNWVKSDLEPADSVIIISEKSSRDRELVSTFTTLADSAQIHYSQFSYSILEGRKAVEPLSRLMGEGTNRVLIASESEAFVNDVVRNLNLMIYNKFNVILYSNAKIRSFETIEVENFHKTALHLCSAYYIDYANPDVADFLLKYRALYKTEPSQFAFAGYDLAYHFLSLCAKYGDDWTAFLSLEKASMLQSAYDFQRCEDGGWINRGTKKAVYQSDWKTEVLSSSPQL